MAGGQAVVLLLFPQLDSSSSSVLDFSSEFRNPPPVYIWAHFTWAATNKQKSSTAVCIVVKSAKVVVVLSRS